MNPSPQFVTDSQGKRVSVLLPIKVYEKMLEDLEELEDIRMYDEVKARNEPTLPFSEYLEKRKQNKNA